MDLTLEQLKATIQAILNTLDQMVESNEIRFKGLNAFQQMSGIIRVLNNIVLYTNELEGNIGKQTETE